MSKDTRDSKDKWEFNCWTGNSRLRITANQDIKRMGQNPKAYLYRAEFWGDSLDYPVTGPWRRTLQQAKRDFKGIR